MAVKVYIVYYSMYGHTERLAKELAKGANLVKGVEATLWQVPETLSTRELDNLGAPPKSHDVPIITPNKLIEADGFIFGFPTRFGLMAPQFKAFLDATEHLCKTQQLAGKPASIITSTSTENGGHEIPPLTIIPLVHHGMIFVTLTLGIGYTFGQDDEDYVVENISGSPTFELMLAFYNGSYFADITKLLKEATA